ncbi:MAG TPA: hypothetical protein VG734_23865 [Lacunisphaera sp.]|nr:hypothetical protein [Lacunisphaera sp.]
MKTLSGALFCLLATLALPANPAPEEWSKVENGIRGRLVIMFDPDFAGTEMPVVYLELQNVSDVANPKEIWLDPHRNFSAWNLRDETGAAVPRNQAVDASIITMGPYWITLPYDSILRFRVSVSGYGIKPNGGMAFQLPGAFWQVPRRPGGGYDLSATFKSAPTEKDQRGAWTGTLVLPAVRVPARK